MGIAGAQGKALFELTLKVAKETADGLVAITTSAVGDFKKSIA